MVIRSTRSIQMRAQARRLLGSYFAAFYTGKDYLLVASGEELLRLSPQGEVMWRASELGVDGVIVTGVEEDLVSGEGEFDPPGRWRPFVVRLDSGKSVS